MPISPIVLQRRHAELGRIRLGNQLPTANGKTRPNKLDRFRFTSASEGFIRDLAIQYGGEARPWDNNGKPEWEVFSEAQTIPVIVVKGGLSQWMETWSGGGCTHRCDGVTNVLTDTPCQTNDPGHLNAKPTTRLSLMLPELEAIGVWRMESHGWNSAAEIPAVAELAQFVGDLVPARLHLMERRTLKDGKTSRFVVPVLDLQIGSARLKEIVNEKSGVAALPAGQSPELVAPGRAALPAAPAVPNYLAQAQQCSSADAVGAIWRKAHAAGHLTEQLAAELTVVGDSLVAAAVGPDAEGAYDVEVIDEGAAAEADMVWQQVLAEGGRQGMNLDAVTNGYAEFSGGLMAGQASASQLSEYLQHLQGVATTMGRQS